MKELIETERLYVSELGSVLKVHSPSLENEYLEKQKLNC